MLHHGVVNEDKAQSLIFLKMDGAGHFAKLLTVELGTDRHLATLVERLR